MISTGLQEPLEGTGHCHSVAEPKTYPYRTLNILADSLSKHCLGKFQLSWKPRVQLQARWRGCGNRTTVSHRTAPHRTTSHHATELRLSHPGFPLSSNFCGCAQLRHLPLQLNDNFLLRAQVFTQGIFLGLDVAGVEQHTAHSRYVHE